MRQLLFILLLAMLGLPSLAQDNELDCDSVLEIWQIQGAGDEANCMRTRIRTEGNIVTAIGPNGFFIQTPVERSDNDLYTSDGIYVTTRQPAASWGLQVGDLITIDGGRVNDAFGTTVLDISNPSQVEIISSGNALPEPFDLSTVDITDYGGALHPMERYEGMLVKLDNALVVAPTNRFDEFGVTINNSRSYREPGIEPDATPQFAGLGLPEWDLNPELLEVDPPEMGLEPLQITPGAVVNIIGNIAYNYNDYQIFPSMIEIVQDAEFAVRPVRPRDSGEFIIATQNMENFFDTVDDPNRDDGRFENYTPFDDSEYAIRLSKLTEQVRYALGAPDILAVQEIENARVLTDLILSLHTADPTLRYTTCFLEGNEGRGIDVAYLIRVDRINMLDCYRMADSKTAIMRGNDVLFSRPPLVLEAEIILEDGESFPLTLINLHIKSLSGIDTEPTQTRRLMQAMMVAEYVQTRIDENLIVLGDMNAFQFTDGIVDVVGIIQGESGQAYRMPEDDPLEPNLISLLERVPQDERYSFVYNGSYQVLDHILTSPAMDAYVTDAMFSRGNADAVTPWYLDETMGAARSADHDGFVIYIRPE